MTAVRGGESGVVQGALGTPRPWIGFAAALVVAAVLVAPASARRVPQPRPVPLWNAYPVAPKASKPLPASSGRIQLTAGRSTSINTSISSSSELPQTALVLLISAFVGAIGLSVVGGRRLVIAADRRLMRRAHGRVGPLTATGSAVLERLESLELRDRMSDRIADARERWSDRTAAVAELVAERWFLIALWVVVAVAAAAGVTALIILESVRYP